MIYTTDFFIFTGILLPIINICLKEQHHTIKLYALYTLDEMAKQSQDLAQMIVDVSILPQVIHFLSPTFTDIKVQVTK